MLDLLLVDDNSASLTTVAEFLRLKKHRVITASGCDLALQILKSLSFHVMIYDAGLPRAGGLDVLRDVKKRYPCMDVFLIIGDGAFDIDAATQNGATDYLRKPFMLEELEARIKKISDRRQTERNHEWDRKWSESVVDSEVVGQSQTTSQLLDRSR